MIHACHSSQFLSVANVATFTVRAHGVIVEKFERLTSFDFRSNKLTNAAVSILSEMTV